MNSNALDKAFIRAYAKGTHGAGASVLEQDVPRAERAAAASQNRAAVEVARLSPLVEVSAADGVWYRIEQAPSAGVNAAPAPHFTPTERAARVPPDAVRAAVEANLSAAEMLDSFLGLPGGAASDPFGESHATLVRVDAPHRDELPPSNAERMTPHSAAAMSLTPAELHSFRQGAACSVIADGWEHHLAQGASSESLCQCWIATEFVTPAILVEQTWIAPAPCFGESIAGAPQPQPGISAVVETAPAPPVIDSWPSKPLEKAPDVKPQERAKIIAAPASTPHTSKPIISEPKASPTFQAAWEVDRLNWPEECDKLARGDAFGPLARTLLETSRRGRKVIAITGTRRGEGRTTVALCLARRAAKEGVRVAILDADFERPHLGRRIGIDMENGWDDVLTDGQPLSEAAVSSLEDQVTVLPLGRRAAAFVSAHTVAALQRASEAFDLVLVDMGPVRGDEAGEPAVEGPSAAAALLVCDRRTASDDDVSSALDQLHAAGIETLGIVETFAQ